MKWTTLITKIDLETGAILTEHEIQKRNLEIKETQTKYKKLNDYHTEKHIYKIYGRRQQLNLF